MVAVDYTKLLDTQYKDLPQKRLLPTGSWFFKALSAKFDPPKEEGKSATVMFVLVPREAGDDVDETELAEFLKDGYDLSINKIFHRIWIQDATDFKKVGTLLSKLGIDVEAMSIGDAIKAVKNNDVVGYVQTRSFKNREGGDETDNTITEFAAIE